MRLRASHGAFGQRGETITAMSDDIPRRRRPSKKASTLDDRLRQTRSEAARTLTAAGGLNSANPLPTQPCRGSDARQEFGALDSRLRDGIPRRTWRLHTALC